MAKSLDTKIIEVGGKEYFSTEWTTRKTYANLFKLGRLFAPVSSAITESLMGGEKLQEVIPGVILFICEEMDDKGFDKFFNMLAEDCTGENGVGKLDMDDLLPHEVMEMLTKLLQQHYKIFFETALTQVKGFIAEMLKVSNLNQTLNKPSKD